MRKVSKHCSANNYPIFADLEGRVQDWICRQLPPNSSVCSANGMVSMPGLGIRRVTGRNILAYISTMASWGWNHKFQAAEQSEANRRAEICAGCPLNVRAEGCLPCFGVDAAIYAVIGGRRTPLDHQLNACAACGCSVKAKIWVPLDTLKAHDRHQGEYPEHCWMV